jgi:RND family efflux transporter MFP subunit
MKPAASAMLMLCLLAAPAASANEMAFDCVAEPTQRVQVGSPVTGLLAEVLVGRGDRVAPGEVVAKLESKVEQANVQLAKAQAEAEEAMQAQQTRLTLAEADLSRSLKLVASGSVTTSKVEELQARAEIARRDLDTEKRKLRIAGIELERQRALLERQSIRSPIRGFITEQSLRGGEFVRQDSPIMTIVQIDPLHIEAYIPVALWGKINKGTEAGVVLDQPDHERRAARVTVIDRVFDAASGTFGVRLELPNPGDVIPAGQPCRLQFDGPHTAATQP